MKNKLECPYCHTDNFSVCSGKPRGIQQYYCKMCNRRYISSESREVVEEIRDYAIRLRKDGLSLRMVAKICNVSKSSVDNWIRKKVI
jgi:transposase-like protein